MHPRQGRAQHKLSDVIAQSEDLDRVEPQVAFTACEPRQYGPTSTRRARYGFGHFAIEGRRFDGWCDGWPVTDEELEGLGNVIALEFRRADQLS